MRVRNVAPFGAVEIPSLGLVIEAGEETDISDVVGAELVSGPNFEPVDGSPDQSADPEPRNTEEGF